MIFFFYFFFKSEPFYLSHTEGSYIGWGRGVAQERDSRTTTTVTQLNCIWIEYCKSFIKY